MKCGCTCCDGIMVADGYNRWKCGCTCCDGIMVADGYNRWKCAKGCGCVWTLTPPAPVEVPTNGR